MKKMKRSFYKETINIDYNPDVDANNPNSAQKIATNNDNIIKYLEKTREKSAAKYLEKILNNNQKDYSDELEKIRKVQDAGNKQIKRLSEVNSGIRDELSKIQAGMIDEQDTSITKNPVKEKTAVETIIQKQAPEKKQDEGWFSTLLSAILGAGMMAFLRVFKEGGPIKFAIKMIELGWDFLKTKVIDVATSIVKAMIEPLEKVMAFITEKLAKIMKLVGMVDDIPFKPSIGAKEGVKEAKVVSEAEKTASTVEKTGATVEKTLSEAESATNTVEKTGAKESLKTATDASKIESTTTKTVEKTVGKEVGESASKSLAKKIPFLGLGIASALAASRIGEGDYTGAGLEIASGVASIIPFIGTGASLGIDAGIMYRDLHRDNENKVSEDEFRIQKMKNDGIIETNYFSKDEINNWDKVRQLPTDDLKALSQYNGFNEDTKSKISAILYRTMLGAVTVPKQDEEEQKSVRMVFNDKELAADELIMSKNELEEFIILHPLTDENITKTVTEVNGEKVTEFKYKDEELNKQYIVLKEKYDEKYKKYREQKYKDLKDVVGMTEINGEYLSNSQLTEFKSNPQYSGMTVKQYAEGQNLQSAKSDVLNKLQEQYKNVSMPARDILDRIKNSEGFEATAKPDLKGTMAIGYGHQIVPGEEYLYSSTITKEQATMMLVNELTTKYIPAAEKIPGYSEAPKSIQDVLVDMTYNMGPAWYKKWGTFVDNLKNKNYDANSEIIKTSLYAAQVKGRAFVNAKVFEEEGKKLASGNVGQPQQKKNEESTVKAETLDTSAAIQTKQKQVQNVNENGKKLASTVNIKGTNNIINNSTSVNANKTESSNISLSETFYL